MTHTPATLSHEEVDRRFGEIVTLCKKLQENKRLHSGYVFGVNKDGWIDVSAIPFEMGLSQSPLDLLASMQSSLLAHQQLRHALAKSFDMNSEDWNKSGIGRMLNYVEQEFRKETYKVEDGEKRDAKKKTYNAFNIVFLSGQVLELYALVLSREFAKKRQRNKLKALDQQSQAFFNRNRNKAALQLMSVIAETILAFDKRRQTHGGEDADRSFMLKTVQTDILNGLKICFKI